MIEIALTAFTTLFVIIDPIGLAPIFVAVTQGMTPAQRNRVAARACLTGFFIIALFGLAGEKALELVGIGMPAFRISGGLLLFLIAVEMLFEKRTPRREKNAKDADQTGDGTVQHEPPAPRHDPTVFPLATPLIGGPGALATMILLVGQHSGDLATQAMLFGVLAAVVLVVFALFLMGNILERALGQTGISVITRLLGMLLAALAVQFVLDGLADLGVFGLGNTG